MSIYSVFTITTYTISLDINPAKRNMTVLYGVYLISKLSVPSISSFFVQPFLSDVNAFTKGRGEKQVLVISY
jgi:hypothetical protein